MSYHPKRPTFLKTLGNIISKGSGTESNSSGSFTDLTSPNGSLILDKYNLDSPINSKTMIGILGNDEEIKEKFSEYADKTLNTENDAFIQQVQYYKTNYSDKSERWRKNICSRIVKIFIHADSSMQINISSCLRDKIIEESTVFPPSINIFDNAFDEVAYMLANGAWEKFVDIERKTGSK